MTKQVVSSPKNKKAFAAQQAIAARLSRSRGRDESAYKAAGRKLRDSKKH